MAVNHYENFPVASWLLPAHLRPAVEAIYAFARGADDVVDEGDDCLAVRQAKLADYYAGLNQIAQKPPFDVHCDTPLGAMFTALAVACEQHALPLQPFYDLLDAFSQDLTQSRYATLLELEDYCHRSANPVGRLMLCLYQQHDTTLQQQSDDICTALQLINMWQDVAIDWRKNRVYIPQQDLQYFAVTEQHIAQGCCDARWQALMAFQVKRTITQMLRGAPLAQRIPGRVGWELRLVVLGGLRIAQRILAVKGDVFTRRPQLSRRDYAVLLWQALRYRHALDNYASQEAAG